MQCGLAFGPSGREQPGDAPPANGPLARGSGRTVEATDHLVLIIEHAIGGLLLKATPGVTIAVVSYGERKRRQPRLRRAVRVP